MIKLLQQKGNASWIRISIWSGLFIIIATFTIINTHSIMTGVAVSGSINTISPDTHIAVVKGNAKNANFVSLNGREIFIDKDGAFTESVALPEGLSVLTLSAEDAEGKMKEQKIEVMAPHTAENVAFNPMEIINN